MSTTYKSTARACYLGNFTQSIIINLTPILFIPLKTVFDFTLTQLAVFTLVNFIAQIASDAVFGGIIDRVGFRPLAIASCVISITGMALFAAAPLIFGEQVYIGLVLATVVFSIAGGLLEVLLSPIVNAIPSEAKAQAMSVLHSFYAWGQVIVVALTSLAVFFFDAKGWQYIVLGWMAVPLVTMFAFIFVPMPPTPPKEVRTRLSKAVFSRVFVACVIVIMCGGATEQIMAQWSSAFLEDAMGMPKIFGDMVGVCGFAVTFGIGRMLYGKFGDKWNLEALMCVGLLSSAVCFIVIAFSANTALTLIACYVCGFSVSLLWPGSLSVAARKFPHLGSSAFALLAMAGDLGCSSGPFMTGLVSDKAADTALGRFFQTKYAIGAEQAGMRVGIFAGAIIPVIGAAVSLVLIRNRKKKGDAL